MPMKNAKVRKWLDGYPWIEMRIEAYRREMEETFKPTREQKYEEARLAFTSQILRLEKKRLEIQLAVESIPDEKARTAVRLRYIEQKSMYEMIEAMHYEETQIYNFIQRGCRAIEEAGWPHDDEEA